MFLREHILYCAHGRSAASLPDVAGVLNSMKITQLETLCLSRLHEPERQWTTARYRTIKADCAIVVIGTDDGLEGIGEACAYGVPGRIREWVAWLGPELIGRDPCDPAIVHITRATRSDRAAQPGPRRQI